MSDRFVDKVLAGTELWTEIDNYVQAWHEGDEDVALHEYLGMTRDEYALWTEQPPALRIILAARKREEPVGELVSDQHEYALAARGLSADDQEAIRSWLQKTGRLPEN